MAVNLNFRTAIGGFHKEDVVHYIEYMNAKHTSQINQLMTENEELHHKMAQINEQPDLSEEAARLQAQLQEAQARQQQLEQERNDAQEALAKLHADFDTLAAHEAEIAAQKLAAQELEAYRRAEQAEREAKARAEQIYQQAVGTLAQATAQVDGAANSFRQVAEQIGCQMQQLQAAVDNGRNALLDAAATLYTISPENTEE